MLDGSVNIQAAAKNQHIVPQTYMRNWCYSGDSVWTLNKKDVPHNTE